MRKLIVVSALVLIFQYGALAGASDLKSSAVRKNELPHAFLTKNEGSVSVSRWGESISLRADRLTLEEILQKIAEERKVTLKFYCEDPALKQEKAPGLTISGDSIVKVLQQLLSGDPKFVLLNREGKPSENGREVATIGIYPMECTGTDHPVRVFVAQREHPLLRKSPEEISVEELRDVLKREGPSSRRRAVEALGMKGDEKGIPYAKEALTDKNERVMLAAATALLKLGQKYGSEKVVDAIYQRFLEKPYADFLFAMVYLDREKIWPLIDGFMDQPRESDWGVIARVLALTNDRRAIKPLLIIAAAGDKESSTQAIYTIGKLGGPEAEKFLLGLLREGDSQRQVAAAQAVHFLPEAEKSDACAEIEKAVRQETVSDAFFYALAGAPCAQALKALIKDPAFKSELKIRVLKSMAQVKSEDFEVMSMGLSDTAPQVRLMSVELLGAVGTEAAIPYLVKATEHEDPKVRLGAVKGISRFSGDDHVAEALGKAVDDTDPSVRRQAVDGLRMLGQPTDTMTKILKKCESHKDPYVADKAGSILSAWGLK